MNVAGTCSTTLSSNAGSAAIMARFLLAIPTPGNASGSAHSTSRTLSPA
ncbi:hypothetical protein KCP78_03235 [Salmonella enterica subsp. enterica]|nr:hypothetical protein KCP78_03235 [Salmonella enterica subsp. enterica]